VPTSWRRHWFGGCRFESRRGLGYFAPRSTQPSIPPGSVNEYQLRLGCKGRYSSFRLRMKCRVCRWNCVIPWQCVLYLSAWDASCGGAIQIDYIYLYIFTLTLRNVYVAGSGAVDNLLSSRCPIRQPKCRTSTHRGQVYVWFLEWNCCLSFNATLTVRVINVMLRDVKITFCDAYLNWLVFATMWSF